MTRKRRAGLCPALEPLESRTAPSSIELLQPPPQLHTGESWSPVVEYRYNEKAAQTMNPRRPGGLGISVDVTFDYGEGHPATAHQANVDGLVFVSLVFPDHAYGKPGTYKVQVRVTEHDYYLSPSSDGRREREASTAVKSERSFQIKVYPPQVGLVPKPPGNTEGGGNGPVA